MPKALAGKVFLAVIVVGLLIGLFYQLSYQPIRVSDKPLSGNAEKSLVIIPKDYDLIAVSAYGEFSGNYTYYGKKQDTGRIYAFNDEGELQREIKCPGESTVVTVAGWGRFTNHVELFCRNPKGDIHRISASD